MTGVWIKNEDGWKTAASQKFGLEKDLHELAEENIHMLPLAGSPNLVVLGSEVSLGSGWADLLAVETTGRPVIIEVKLARNAEARRAIVAQALSYAAWLGDRRWRIWSEARCVNTSGSRVTRRFWRPFRPRISRVK